jgi:hypothetical protein
MSDENKRIVRAALGEIEFRRLCEGEIVTLWVADGTMEGMQVEIILSDIGFDRMMLAVLGAEP